MPLHTSHFLEDQGAINRAPTYIRVRVIFLEDEGAINRAPTYIRIRVIFLDLY